MRPYFVAIALILLAVGPAAAHNGGEAPIHQPSVGPGWIAQRFTMTGSVATITVESTAGEIVGHLAHVYDGTGRFLFGVGPFLLRGGDKPDVVIASAQTGELGTDTTPPSATTRTDAIAFSCPTSCNPSRDFILVVTAGGDNLTNWGFAVTGTGITPTSSWSGSSAGVVPARQFDGTVAHAASDPTMGVHVVNGASLRVQASNTFITFFGKLNADTPTSATMERPAGPLNCPARGCVLAKSPAGMYTYHYAETGASSDEAYAFWADIRLSP